MNNKYKPQYIELLKVLGYNLKKFRLQKNISIEELSKETEINQSYLYKIEKGQAPKLSCDKLIKIAKSLSLNVELLFAE